MKTQKNSSIIQPSGSGQAAEVLWYFASMLLLISLSLLSLSSYSVSDNF